MSMWRPTPEEHFSSSGVGPCAGGRWMNDELMAGDGLSIRLRLWEAGEQWLLLLSVERSYQTVVHV